MTETAQQGIHVLVVVDMQNDFIDGALGTPEAVAMLPRAEARIREFDGTVFLPGIPIRKAIS